VRARLKARRSLLVLAAALAVAGCGGTPKDKAPLLTSSSSCNAFQSLTPEEQQQAVEELSQGTAGAPPSVAEVEAACADAGSLAPLSQVLTDNPSSSSATAASFQPTRTYEWEVEGDSGATARLKLELAEPFLGSEPLPSGFEGLDSACTVDAQRDAVIPIRLEVENTTDSFDLAAAVDLRVRQVKDEVSAPLGFDAASSFSDGPSCDALSSGSIDDGTGVKFESVSPGGSDDHNWLVVVHNYYSPAQPDGANFDLGNWFAVLSARDSTSSLLTTCFRAPRDKYAFIGGILAATNALSPAFPLNDTEIPRGPSSPNQPDRCS
jgi:hypothetical protein